MEDKYQQCEKLLHQRDTQIVGMESELRQSGKNSTSLECEKDQLKLQTDRLNEEIRSMTTLNGTLEQRLSMEKNSVSVDSTRRD